VVERVAQWLGLPPVGGARDAHTASTDAQYQHMSISGDLEHL
jgi:hypothetical protein